MSKEAKPEFDVRSAKPVLSYVGPSVVSGIPARDLSANDLARFAWIRRRGDVDDKAIAAIRDELVATGQYTETK